MYVAVLLCSPFFAFFWGVSACAALTLRCLAGFRSVEGVRKALAAGADVLAWDAAGQTALHHACWERHAAVVSELVAAKGIDADAKTDAGAPVFIAAIGRGAVVLPPDRDDPACLAVLVQDGGVDITEPTLREETGLMLAATYGYANIVEYMLMVDGVATLEHLTVRGGCWNRSAAEWARAEGHHDIAASIEAALDGCREERKAAMQDKMREASLMSAQARQEAERQMLEEYSRSESGGTYQFVVDVAPGALPYHQPQPLLEPSYGGLSGGDAGRSAGGRSSVAARVGAGAGAGAGMGTITSVDAESKLDADTSSVLHSDSRADAAMSTAIMASLAAENAEALMAKEKEGPNSLLIAAAKDNSPKDAKAALADGADVNCRDRHGYTPAHIAAVRRHAAVLEVMASTKGVDLNLVEPNSGDTIVHAVMRQPVRSKTASPLDRLVAAGDCTTLEVLLNAKYEPPDVRFSLLVALCRDLCVETRVWRVVVSHPQCCCCCCCCCCCDPRSPAATTWATPCCPLRRTTGCCLWCSCCWI